MGASRKSIVQVGGVFNTNNDGKIEVIEVWPRKALIKFINTGSEKVARKCDIIAGKVKDNQAENKYGGILGSGEYPSTNFKHVYTKWYDMLKRCSPNAGEYLSRYYGKVSVSPSWLNFQNFAMWYSGQKYLIENEPACLDKDLLGYSDLYSEYTCCVIPRSLNMFIIRFSKDWKGYCFHNQNQNYVSRRGGKTVGSFSSTEEAKIAYNLAVEIKIKEVIDSFEGKLEEKVIHALHAKLHNHQVKQILEQEMKDVT